MSDESQQPLEQSVLPPRPTLPKTHANSQDVEYDEVFFKLRESDKHILLNSYLVLLLQNVERASKEFAVPASQHLARKDGETATLYLEQYIFFLKEAQELFHSLMEGIEETFLPKSKLFAKIKAETGVPYTGENLNKMINESQEELRTEKKRIEERKEAKHTAATKRKASKKK
jgi:hypothetical protein